MTTTPPPVTPPPATPVTPVAGPSKVLSLIGMIVGIVGVFISFFGGWGFVLSVGAIVLGFIGRKREGAPAKGFWLTAIITGFAGILVSIIWLIVFIALIAIGVAANGTSTY